MRPAALLPLTAAALLTAVTALAEMPPTRLEYSTGPGAESCPDAGGFRHVVASHIGDDPFTDGAARRLTVQITRKGERFDGGIVLYDAAGKNLGNRDHEDYATCGSLVHALAESIALIIGPRTKAPGPPQAPALTATPQLATEPPAAEAHPPAAQALAPDSPARTASGARPEVGAGFLLPIGAAPAVTAGFSASFGYRWRSISLNIEGRAYLPRSADESSDNVRAASTTFMGAFVPCAHLWWIIGCGTLSAGAVRVTGYNTLPGEVWGPRVEIGARLGVQIPVYGRFSAQLSGDILFPLVKYGIIIDDNLTWDPPPVAVLPALRIVAAL